MNADDSCSSNCILIPIETEKFNSIESVKLKIADLEVIN